MEYIHVTKVGGPGTGFHLEGFPDGVKVIALTDPKAIRVAHLVLHLTDLGSENGDILLRSLAADLHMGHPAGCYPQIEHRNR